MWRDCCSLAQEGTRMSKSKDSKSATKKAPQKTLMEKRQAKRDKKNKPMSIG